MRRIILGLCLSLAALAGLASTALASHAPAYPLPAAACNQGTERALEKANWNAYGSIPINEGPGCHHHHP